ncbi:UNKNOWN [Stylonychia lemnae]|uniref:Uncharacterized protein n=1 Tax=Stylonychia lemnae TaxID=5949 RepID=A0A077ZZZ4_STYLE|nr:UNKNOWN [Stylonychia lemnae]|eukprot:CDW74093.1 UNKNOWN [Stylonychia lemnae]
MSQFNQQQNQIAICQQCGAKYRRGTTHNCVAQIREEYDLKFQQQDQKLNDLQNLYNQLQQNLNRVSNEPRPGSGYGALNQGNFGIIPDQQQLTSQIKFHESKIDWIIDEVKEKFKSTENRIYAMNKEIGALQSNRCCVHCNMEPRIQKIISPNEQLFENQWGYAKPNDNNMGNYFHQQQQQQHPNNNFKRQERQQDQNYREKSPNLLRQDIGQQNFNERVPINRQPINNYDVQGRLLHKSRDTSMDNRPAFQTKQNSFSGFPEDQVTPGVYYDHQKKNASSEFLQDPPIFNQIQQQQPIQNRNQQQQRQPLQYQQNQQQPLFDSSIFGQENPNLPHFNQQNNQRQQQQYQNQHHPPNQFQQQQQQRDSRQNMNQNQFQRHDPLMDMNAAQDVNYRRDDRQLNDYLQEEVKRVKQPMTKIVMKNELIPNQGNTQDLNFDPYGEQNQNIEFGSKTEREILDQFDDLTIQSSQIGEKDDETRIVKNETGSISAQLNLSSIPLKLVVYMQRTTQKPLLRTGASMIEKTEYYNVVKNYVIYYQMFFNENRNERMTFVQIISSRKMPKKNAQTKIVEWLKLFAKLNDVFGGYSYNMKKQRLSCILVMSFKNYQDLRKLQESDGKIAEFDLIDLNLDIYNDDQVLKEWEASEEFIF